MRLSELDAHMQAIFRPRETAGMDRAINGIQVGRSAGPISRVAFGVDAALETIRRAAAWGAQVLFIHHGLFWGIHRPVTDNHYERIRALILADMALYALHLPLDLHPSLGNNALIADALELVDRSGHAPDLALQAAAQGLDCYVTGELGHELYHDCLERGLNVLYGGHYRTEVCGVRRMAAEVASTLGLETTFVDVATGM